MPDTAILVTINLLADLSADVTAVRGWPARVHAGYGLDDRERAAVARQLAALRTKGSGEQWQKVWLVEDIDLPAWLRVGHPGAVR